MHGQNHIKFARYSCLISMKLQNFSEDFLKVFKCKNSLKTIHREPSCSVRSEGRREDRHDEANTCKDDKVRELATVCLPWQHWTIALVWFDDVHISVFHSSFDDL